MATMTELEKLGVLLPHWMEHNAEHAAEFRGWAAKARDAGREAAAVEIEKAAGALAGANEALSAALRDLAGPAKGDG